VNGTGIDRIRRWIEHSPYAAALGVRAVEITDDVIRLHLPFAHENSNGDTALHGGVAASLADIGALALARSALGDGPARCHTAALHVAYLGAALGESIDAEARRLRRGRELVFVDVAVASASGKPVARALATVRGGVAGEATPPPESPADDGTSDPGPMGPYLQHVPFHAKLGLVAEHLARGRSRIVMPWRDANADEAGGVHEGAVLALLDTTGAMAAWAATGPGRFKASTPGLQARFFAPPDRTDLVGFGRVLLHDRETLFVEVDVARREDSRLVARGTVHYRIVRPARSA
jgi:uncharacterized protein (TIGR00369 family)